MASPGSALALWNATHVRSTCSPAHAAFIALGQDLEYALGVRAGRNIAQSWTPGEAERASAEVRERLTNFLCEVVGIRWLAAGLSACEEAEACVLLAEAINLAAKILHPHFYELKGAALCAAALHPDVQSGWGRDGCFYLCSPGVGEICLHVHPSQGAMIAAQLGLTKLWPGAWSGCRRQHAAFLAIACPKARRLLDEATRLRLCSPADAARKLAILALQSEPPPAAV